MGKTTEFFLEKKTLYLLLWTDWNICQRIGDRLIVCSVFFCQATTMSNKKVNDDNENEAGVEIGAVVNGNSDHDLENEVRFHTVMNVRT